MTSADKTFVIVERPEFERFQALVRTVQDGDLPTCPNPSRSRKLNSSPFRVRPVDLGNAVGYTERMSDLDPSDSSERPGQPGTTRTWWHPLLARLLDHVSS